MAVVPDAYSLLSQVALDRLFPAAERFGMGVVVATPLERGILATGVAGAGEHYARRFSPEVLKQVQKVEAVCRQHGVSLLVAALQFVTRHPVVATTIPGPRTPDEARQNALAGAEPIPEDLWQALQPLVKTWENRAARVVGEHDRDGRSGVRCRQRAPASAQRRHPSRPR
jgi:D-threo-aldose 1-dehydrogenase